MKTVCGRVTAIKTKSKKVIEDGVEGENLNFLTSLIHRLNAEWWHDIETGEPLDRNVGEMLMLVVSEIGEAMEADRKDLMDDKLPHRKGLEVELADAVIRIFDIAGAVEMDLGGAIVEKLLFNMNRPDHKPENRAKENGKKY